MIHFSHALLVLICLLLPVSGAVAQPAATPAEQEQVAAPPAADATGDTNMKANIAAAREQQRTTAATRQQIQAIRAALRARLAALHR